MYSVTVFVRHDSVAYDHREFAFGTWNEIGLWLDHYGYNSERYRLEIRFVES